jgi:hypothetical protein
MGHHIRDCVELAEKNRRQAMKTSAQFSEQKTPGPSSKRPSHKNIKNSFANLYSSSDDEIEDGEIVETRSEEGSCGGWNRSGIKSIHVPICEPIQNKETEYKEDEYKEYIYEPLYYNKYKGWSWVDIEYDSDNE